MVLSVQIMKDRVRAFVYIDVKSGRVKEFLQKLMKRDEIVEAHIVTGQYDVLAVLELGITGKGLPFYGSVYDMITEVIEGIRKLGNVRDTNTIIPVYSVTKKK